MVMKNNKDKNPIKLVAFATIAAFVGVYAWMILIHVVVEVYEIKKFGSKAIGKNVSEQMFNNNTVLIIFTYVVMEIIMLLITCLMVKKYKQNKLKLKDIGMKLDNNSFKYIIYGFGIAFVMVISTIALMNALGLISFLGYGFVNQSPLKVVGTVILMFIVNAFPGFCEEILYRGVIQNYLMKKINIPLSLLISSILFSLLHIGRYQDWNLITIIMDGIVFGYIFVKTKSLYITIGLHWGYDFFGMLIGSEKTMFNTNCLLAFQEGKNIDFLSSVVSIGVSLLLLFIILAKYNNKIFKANQSA